MVEIQNILYMLMQQIHKILGHSFRKAMVYGSYARGDYNENSDIDVMVLTTLADEDIRDYENLIYDAAYDLELQYGIHISIIIKNEEHFNYWSDILPFYRNVEKDGVVIDGQQDT